MTRHLMSKIDEWLNSGAGPEEKNFNAFNITKENFIITVPNIPGSLLCRGTANSRNSIFKTEGYNKSQRTAWRFCEIICFKIFASSPLAFFACGDFFYPVILLNLFAIRLSYSYKSEFRNIVYIQKKGRFSNESLKINKIHIIFAVFGNIYAIYGRMQ